MKPKRAKPYSAMNASRKMLEAEGWLFGVTEQTIKTGKIVFKRDLFGFCDAVCLSPTRGIVFLQSTGGGNMAARVAKIKENPNHAIALACGIRIIVHDWVKRAGKTQRECRVFEITKEEV